MTDWTVESINEEKPGYYTITCDYCATGEGMHRMILIGFYRSAKQAMQAFICQYGASFAPYMDCKLGLEVDTSHLDLLTDFAKKQITKLRAKDPNAPVFNYSQSTYVNYS